MNAARDGVDRLGSPSLGASVGSGANTPSLQTSGQREGSVSMGSGEGVGASSGSGAAGNMSENLRNIGKFFKRDLGGFGGGFGGRFGGGG
jgi:vacuolar protein sorting-associated protein 53